MKKNIRIISALIVVFLLAFLNYPVSAQDEQQATEQEQPDNRPVRGWFETGMLIDLQTPITPAKGALELNIHHRFSKFEKKDDLFGVYGASNIRMGLNYGITDKLMVGFGTEKDRKLQEFIWKYSILQQTRSGSMPVSLSYFGNFVINGLDKSFYESTKIEYKYIHRFSYFSQLAIARKFNNTFALEVAPSFMYFNAVDSIYKNYNVGLSAGAKIKFSPSWGLILEYDQAYIKSDKVGAVSPKPNFGIGFEKGTATHCFQFFASSYRSIVPQYNLAMNENDFFGGDIFLGFNITVRF